MQMLEETVRERQLLHDRSFALTLEDSSKQRRCVVFDVSLSKCSLDQHLNL